MHVLHGALLEDPHLRSAVAGVSERLAKNPLKRALVLDFNPYWLALYRLHEAGVRPRREHPFVLLDRLGLPVGGSIPDLTFRSPLAAQLTRDAFGTRRGGDGPLRPYMLRIIASAHIVDSTEQASPTSRHDAKVRAPAMTQGFREQLRRAAVAAPIPTIVEPRSDATLMSTGQRIEYARGSSGTLGGYVRDRTTGRTYGVTCGHVVGQGARVSGQGAEMGECTHCLPPVPHPPGARCHAGCATESIADVALISVPGTPPNWIRTTVAPFVTNGDTLTMRVVERGPVTYEVGGAVVEHSIGGACFSRLFEVMAPLHGITPMWFRVATAKLPQPGDSGAWLIKGDAEWAGMVVAADAIRGFATDASVVLNEASARFGMQLEPA